MRLRLTILGLALAAGGASAGRRRHCAALLGLRGLGGHDVVGVWRPGGMQLSLKRVRLPQCPGGSDAFAPLG
jgi:hypothetical protein